MTETPDGLATIDDRVDDVMAAVREHTACGSRIEGEPARSAEVSHALASFDVAANVEVSIVGWTVLQDRRDEAREPCRPRSER